MSGSNVSKQGEESGVEVEGERPKTPVVYELSDEEEK